MSSGYKWKASLFLGEGGVPRWRKYAIFSYFLCGTSGIWKKACPFISGTKGSGQGHVGLEVNTSRYFSRSWRRWRNHSPGLFAWRPPAYGGLPMGRARGWRLSAGYLPFCRPWGSCTPILSLGRCANWGRGWQGTQAASKLATVALSQELVCAHLQRRGIEQRPCVACLHPKKPSLAGLVGCPAGCLQTLPPCWCKRGESENSFRQQSFELFGF